ncbi:Uncharacterized protein OS=alpha proteobacterium BAL199 GN=BAL199_29882 PE=4 SV=1 [Gemmata massiliana]|uniref:Uncharacterized protein n=1 Tax=Gemmata massiliana TaxID=1210884 RepID=A0A6P2CWY8_9BACT|nr:hypothetical protein [Gemmata massiliana]VTR92906.1 Uncharacterized protein OS=alpha proteobacterium BAL199 GN=BAL199_29882 PE=4 SV=1 [Gemmata massiliana]
MSRTEPERDPFFIGWFPMPRRYARFLFPIACAVVIASVIGGAGLAWGQRAPGSGGWGGGPVGFTGVVYAEPYAMIRVPDAAGGAPRTVLLVSEGKFGAKDRVEPHDGRPVRVVGTLLSREGVLMLELADGTDGLCPVELPEAEQASLRRKPAKALGSATTRGEIVDSKCYLGAMKPGGGRTHKGCAVLCLKGGVPPLLVARDGTPYLLTSAGGGPLDPVFCERAAEDILVSGVIEMWDDVRVFRAAAEN